MPASRGAVIGATDSRKIRHERPQEPTGAPELTADLQIPQPLPALTRRIRRSTLRIENVRSQRGLWHWTSRPANLSAICTTVPATPRSLRSGIVPSQNGHAVETMTCSRRMRLLAVRHSVFRRRFELSLNCLSRVSTHVPRLGR